VLDLQFTPWNFLVQKYCWSGINPWALPFTSESRDYPQWSHGFCCAERASPKQPWFPHDVHNKGFVLTYYIGLVILSRPFQRDYDLANACVQNAIKSQNRWVETGLNASAGRVCYVETYLDLQNSFKNNDVNHVLFLMPTFWHMACRH
jgi:hypothetical protein